MLKYSGTKVILTFAIISTALAARAHATDGIERPIELSFKECVFTDLPGADRTHAGVTLGIPFTKEQGVRMSGGRPQLGIIADERVESWQFSTFELANPADANSPVLWATLDLVLSNLGSGQELRGIHLQNGTGKSAGPNMATPYSDHIEIDTGSAVFSFEKDGFAFLDQASTGGTPVLSPSPASGIFLKAANGTIYGSRWGHSEARIVRNGPAMTKILVEGELTNEQGSRVIATYTCEILAYAGSKTLEFRVGLGAGHPDNLNDLLFDWAHIVCHPVAGSEGANTFDVRATGYGQEISQGIRPGQVLSHVQYQSDRPLEGEDHNYYYPGLPKQDFRSTNRSSQRIISGYSIMMKDGSGETQINGTTDPSRCPNYQVMDVSQAGTNVGVAVVNRWATNEFPTGIEVGGTGWLTIKLWPEELPDSYSGERIHYCIPRQYCESKEFTLTLHNQNIGPLYNHGTRNTYEVEGRFARFEDYGEALFRERRLPALPAVAQTMIYRWMGLIDTNTRVEDLIPVVYWSPANSSTHFEEVAFLQRNRTGGNYNSNKHERNLLSFLRFGRAGSFQLVRSYVDYVRNYHFRHLKQEGCMWEEPSQGHGYPYVTTHHDSDTEHDWWRSVRLWARLKGDEALRDEFIDHGRTLSGGNTNLVYYRAWVKGIESLALTLSLSRYAYPPSGVDPCTGVGNTQQLENRLRARLNDWFHRVYDPSDPYGSEGWKMPWGSLIPNDLGNPWTNPNGFPGWGTTTHMDRGIKHDICYECVDENCRDWFSAPHGRRVFQESLASSAFALAESALPHGDPLRTELFLRVGQIGFNIMSILHWNQVDSPCGREFPTPWQKQGDAAHVWLAPPCEQPGWNESGPLQERSGPGHLNYVYAGEAARHVMLQYLALNRWDDLNVARTKFHEILSAQRFQDDWNSPCPGSTSWNGSALQLNINDPGHWGFLMMAIKLGAGGMGASYPAYNPEAR